MNKNLIKMLLQNMEGKATYLNTLIKTINKMVKIYDIECYDEYDKEAIIETLDEIKEILQIIDKEKEGA